MRIRSRLILLIGLAALAPLLLASLSATRIADQQAVELVEALHRERAEGLAGFTASWLDDHLQGLELGAASFSLETLSPDGRQHLLQLIYRQYRAVNVAAMIGADGVAMGPALYLTEIPADEPDFAGHQVVDRARVDEFSRRLPLALALERGSAIGRAWRPEGSDAAVVSVALASPARGAALAVELSLTEVSAFFREQQTRGGGALVLLGGDRTELAGTSAGLVDPSAFRAFGQGIAGEARYALDDGTEMLAAFAPVPETPWMVVVAVPYRLATEAGRTIQQQMLFWFFIAAVMATLLGWLGALQIARPVVQLKDAALSVAEGDLGKRVKPEGSRELLELTRAFNFMSYRLDRNRQEIATQREEIEVANRELEAFNRELQDRVDERTRELREAQDRLVQSSRLAAVAHMGAGLAHELNNPVAGILGMTQLARLRHKNGPLDGMLSTVEQEAIRCSEILRSLHRLTEERASAERVAVDLHALVDEVLALAQEEFTQKQLRVEHARGEGEGALTALGDPAQLGQALSQLLRSIRADLAPGGGLTIAGERGEDEICLRVSLDGAVAGDRDDWLASGMGYWIARQILHRHGGRLEEPAEASPQVYQIVLPRA